MLERHADKILGVLSCFDRVIIHGTLPGFNYAAGMSSYLRSRDIRDYARFAEPLRDLIRNSAERGPADNGIDIEHLRKRTHRKELDDRFRHCMRMTLRRA